MSRHFYRCYSYYRSRHHYHHNYIVRRIIIAGSPFEGYNPIPYHLNYHHLNNPYIINVPFPTHTRSSSSSTTERTDTVSDSKNNPDNPRDTILANEGNTMGETETTAGDNNIKIIQEGSCSMKYPISDDNQVFYNPVQVQNRDVSIIMISLYIERYAKRQLHQYKMNELKKERQKQQNQQQTSNNSDPSSTSESPKILSIQEQVNEYMQSISGLDAIQWMMKQQEGKHGGISILDALAASGLRSMRYWKEIHQGIQHITINDYELAAIERARDNIQHNQLQHILTDQRAGYGIRINHNDAIDEMYRSRPNILRPTKEYLPYHVIDLDPYGSASSFLDAAIQAIHEHGMLCVTCTDMVALGGSHPETAYSRYYGSMPIPHADYLQEMAIRILLYSIAMTAAKYSKSIHPILSVGMNFYVRVFVEVSTNKAAMNQLSTTKIGRVYQSTQCPSYYIVPAGQLGGKNNNSYQPPRMPMIPKPSSNCSNSNGSHISILNDNADTRNANDPQHQVQDINPDEQQNKKKNGKGNNNNFDDMYIGCCQETGSTFKIGGPIWIGPLHDKVVINDALQRLDHPGRYPDMKHISTSDRIYGLLVSCYEELDDVPLYYSLPSLAKTLHISTPPIESIRNALINAGYQVSGYHKEPSAIKTNASNQVMWDILKHWVQLHPPKKPTPPNSIAAKILSIPSTLNTVNFSTPTSPKPSFNSHTTKKITRFPMNPEAHWGPKPAAKKSNKGICTPTSNNDNSKHQEGEEQEDEHESNHDEQSQPATKKPKL